jgi:Rrf2 family transcriptional regulator, cysteine metabolism repressor
MRYIFCGSCECVEHAFTHSPANPYNRYVERPVRAIRMNISVKSEYALLAVFDLSLQPPGEPVKIADVARRQKIPQKFLELILAGLKQGGFVESRRGAEGGYRLAKPANEITVGDVLRFVEDTKHTKRVASNPFHQIWQQVDAAVAAILEHTTFAELARTWQKSQTRYVANWDI